MKREFKIGLMIICSFLIALFGINYLKGSSFFDNDRVFYGLYDSVSGLTESNSITYSGFRVGKVRSVAFSATNPGKLLVTMEITNKDCNFPKDSRAIIMNSLMGEASISIVPGKGSIFAESGDTLNVQVTPGITEAVYSELEPIKAKSLELISSVDSLLEITRSIVKDDAQPNLSEGFQSIRKGLKAMENSAYKLDGLINSEKDRLSDIFKNLETITDAFAGNSNDLNTIIQNFSQISDTLVKADLAGVVERAGKAVSDVGQIMSKINEGDGSMGLLINNDSLHNALVASSEELTLLMEDMRSNPKRYVHFSIFGKKDKSLKLSSDEKARLKKLLDSPE